jgi:hypothetical protein
MIQHERKQNNKQQKKKMKTKQWIEIGKKKINRKTISGDGQIKRKR